MNWMTGFETAVEYIENNLTHKLDYEEIASKAYCSSFHFQRIFSMFAGCTLGEYIRKRRMTLAAAQLKSGGVKVLELAVMYGYESPESFSRAFKKFHGVTPSAAKKKGVRLKSFSRLSNYESVEGGNIIDYSLEQRESITLLGFKRRFGGAPYGCDRQEQEKNLLLNTRLNQFILKGISAVTSSAFAPEKDYCIVDHFDDEGYDFYYAQPVCDDWGTITDGSYDYSDLEKFRFEKIVIPKTTYAVFRTDRERYPGDSYITMCKQIICEWLPSTNYQIANLPELVIYHWYQNPRKEDRYIEIFIPVELVE